MNKPTASTISLSFVIPLYKTEKTISILVDRLLGLEIAEPWEVIFVDDGSPDNTYIEIKKYLSIVDLNATLVRHTKNFGEHQAVVTGYRHSRGDYVVNIDDDLQNPPEEAIKLWSKARNNDLDAVYADFSHHKKHSYWRNLGSRFANKTAQYLLNLKEPIYLASFRCLSRPVANHIADCPSPFVYIDGLVVQFTSNIGTVPVRHDPRQVGISNYNLKRLIGLWLVIVTGFSVAPLRFASVIGLIVLALTTIGILLILAEVLIIGATVPGWVSIMTALFFFGGLQCFVLGILGEYVGRIFLTVSGKPQSAVKTVDIFPTPPPGTQNSDTPLGNN